MNRTSVAEYDPPVALGSPTSFFGNPVGCANCGALPGIWASVNGRGNQKVDGNAISAEWCANTTADNCKGNGRSNTDLDTDGMLLQISNPKLESLNIELYDPGFIGASNKQPDQTTCSDGSAYPACTGESTLNVQPGATIPVATKYTLYPLDTLTNPLGSAPVCTVTYPGYQFLTDAVTANDRTFRGYHKWVNLANEAGCPALTGSSYVLQIQSGDDLGGAAQAGSNMFSVAACTGCSTSQPQNDPNVAISAITKMSIFSNSNASNPEFYLARVPSWAQGQSLTLNFFDIGDISDKQGHPLAGLSLSSLSPRPMVRAGRRSASSRTARIRTPPAAATTPPTTSMGRRLHGIPERPKRNGHPAISTLTGLGGGCTAQVTLNGTGSYWQGKWVTFKVPIPSDYTCNDTDFTKCWLKIKYNYPPGITNFHDATTWTASLSGNPVRLTK